MTIEIVKKIVENRMHLINGTDSDIIDFIEDVNAPFTNEEGEYTDPDNPNILSFSDVLDVLAGLEAMDDKSLSQCRFCEHITSQIFYNEDDCEGCARFRPLKDRYKEAKDVRLLLQDLYGHEIKCPDAAKSPETTLQSVVQILQAESDKRKDSLFGDGIRYALELIEKETKKEEAKA